MEAVGIVVGVIPLVLQVHEKFKNDTAAFLTLHTELLSFKTLLRAVGRRAKEHSDFLAIQTGCYDVIFDIQKMISKYDRLDVPKRSSLQRFRWSFEDVNQLRARLTLQISMLSTCASVLNFQQDTNESPVPAEPSIATTPGITSDSSNSESQSNFRTNVENALRRFDPPESLITTIVAISQSRNGPPNRPDSLVSEALHQLPSLSSSFQALGLNSENPRATIASTHSLPYASSLSSKSTTSSLSAKSKSKIPSILHRHNTKHYTKTFIDAAKRNDIDKLRELNPHIDQKTLSKALLAIIQDTPSAQIDQTPTARFLIQAGASLSTTDPNHDRTLLIWAILTAKTRLVDLFLVEHPPLRETRDPGPEDFTPLIWAVTTPAPIEITQCLIRYGANLEAKDWVLQRTPLLWAARTGNKQALELLLDKDPLLMDACDVHGLSPAVVAYEAGFRDIATMLLERGHGADVRLRSGDPFLLAALEDRDEALALLLVENNAPVDAHNLDGAPAVLIAAKNQMTDVLKVLLRSGADPDACDGTGFTALMWGAVRDNKNIVEILLEHGANATLRDRKGFTARKCAEVYGCEKVIELLGG